MDSAIKRLEKQVGETNREIAGLNERVGGLEQILSAVKDFIMEIKEVLDLREERGKSPLAKSLNKPSPVQMARECYSRLSAYKQLLSLRQSTTVARYKEQFELLSAPIIRDMSEEMIISTFITGLNDDIEAELQSTERRNLAHVMSLAQEIEDKLKMKEDELETVMMVPSIVALTNPHYHGEIETGRSTMEVSRGTSMSKTVSKPKEEQDTVVGKIQNALPMKSTDSSTFKFRAKIGSKEVIVKIGTSMHNFISTAVVAELKLPVERTRSYRVNFGFGHKAEGTGVCKNVALKVQGIEIVDSFFSATLRIADVMLGWEWLRNVGAILSLASPETMTFKWRGRTTITIQSDPSLTQGLEFGRMTLEWDEED